jgi:hypothetical protein
MRRIRNNYGNATRIICFLFAVHLFNFSIDPKDQHEDFVPEDLSVNDIESFTEFIAETIFGLDNAFAERDEADSADGGSVDFTKIFFVSQAEAHAMTGSFSTIQVKYFIWDTTASTLVSMPILAPPPKA